MWREITLTMKSTHQLEWKLQHSTLMSNTPLWMSSLISLSKMHTQLIFMSSFVKLCVQIKKCAVVSPCTIVRLMLLQVVLSGYGLSYDGCVACLLNSPVSPWFSCFSVNFDFEYKRVWYCNTLALNLARMGIFNGYEKPTFLQSNSVDICSCFIIWCASSWT